MSVKIRQERSILEKLLLHDEVIDQPRHAKAAATRFFVLQLAEEMERQGISKTQMALNMKTSRAQINRIFKGERSMRVDTLQRAAALVGRELRIELV